MADEIRFYLDENVQIVIADQLKRRGIGVVTVRDLGRLSDNDENHLRRATQMEHVLCTHDMDFLRLAAEGVEHTGIVYGVQEKHTIGDWVKFLALVHNVCTPDDMQNRVEFL